MTETKTHPALTINNINQINQIIRIPLDIGTSEYSSWAELFKIHCRAHQVLDHLTSEPPAISKDKDKEASSTLAFETWSRLDAIVLEWIFATISKDLIQTILEPNATAKQAWDRLKSIFEDNKNSRAVYFEQQFQTPVSINSPICLHIVRN